MRLVPGAVASPDSPQAPAAIAEPADGWILKTAAIVFALPSRRWALAGKNRLLVRAGGAGTPKLSASRQRVHAAGGRAVIPKPGLNFL
jgi:hypothetical protein